MNIRVTIADDHSFIRLGLRSILSNAGIDVVAEADGGRALLERVNATACDVIVTDLRMPTDDLDGVNLVRALLRLHPSVPVVVYSGAASPAVLGKLWHAGARGIVGKEDPDDQLVRAVRTAAGGGSYCSTRLRQVLDARDVLHTLGTTDLSPGERHVVQLLSEGCTLEEIGRVRQTSPKTSSRQKTDAFNKLGVRGTHEIYDLVQEFPELLCAPGVPAAPQYREVSRAR